MNKDGILHDTEKTSAGPEQYKNEATKKKKDSLDQKVKGLLQILENQAGAFQIFRVKIIAEMRERNNFLRKMSERIQRLEILRKIREEQEEYYMKKEEQIKREASEREKDPSERKVEELQRKLENQKRVSERLRARMRKEIREREKTSAEEWARGEATEREKEPLEQKLKELQSKMEGNKSIFLKGVKLKLTKMREIEDLLRRMNERFEMLEILGMIKDELGECSKKTDELLCDAAKTLAECTEGEPSEKEKELLEQKYKEISQKVEDQKKDFEEFLCKMIDKTRKKQEILAEERAKREAAEREEELLEEKVKELQEQLEDQERVSEEFRVETTEKQREREKTSAEMLVQWKIEKKLLKQKIKEWQQKLEDQERTFKRFRVKLTKEMKEKDKLLRKMDEKIQKLEHLLRLPEKLEAHYMEKGELLCEAGKKPSRKRGELSSQWSGEVTAVPSQTLTGGNSISWELSFRECPLLHLHLKKQEEQAEREADERENEPLVKELQQKSENQERIFEISRVKMTEELNARKKASAEEQIKREATEREKESLEKQIKELQQYLEDQERIFQRLRAEMAEEMIESEKALAEEQIKRAATEREKESLEKQVKELQQNLEDQEKVFQRLRAEMTEEMRESEKALAEEQAKREAAERKKKLLEQKLKELQLKFEDQERSFEAFRVQMTEEMRKRDNSLRKMNERIEMLEAAMNNDNDKDNEENTEKD